MMPDLDRTERLSELVGIIREGQATPDQMAELEQMVIGSSDMAERYVRLVSLQNSLRWIYSSDLPPFGKTESDSSEEHKVGSRSPVLGFLSEVVDFAKVHHYLSLILAFAVAGLLASLVAIGIWPASQGSAEVVATVSGSVDVRWSETDNPLSVGDGLVVGRSIEIDRGIVNITFNNGVKVTVEGPASFSASGQSALDLADGTLVARVPASAVGFQVVLPSATVIDRGTIFGVRNDKVSGQSDVYVFEGEVDAVLPADSGSSGVQHRLKTGEGASFKSGDTGFQKTPVDLSIFSHGLLREFRLEEQVDERQARKYILSQSYMRDSPGTFDVVGNRADLKPDVLNTVCVVLRIRSEEDGLTVGDQVEVLLPELDPGTLDGQFLMVSTVSHQPGGQSSFGLRLRRDHRGIWAMPYSRRFTVSTDPENVGERTVLADPGGDLRFIIKRITDTRIKSYYISADDPTPVQVGDDEIPELGIYHRLYIGVQAYCHSKSRVYSFRDLKIVPIDTSSTVK